MKKTQTRPRRRNLTDSALGILPEFPGRHNDFRRRALWAFGAAFVTELATLAFEALLYVFPCPLEDWPTILRGGHIDGQPQSLKS